VPEELSLRRDTLVGGEPFIQVVLETLASAKDLAGQPLLPRAGQTISLKELARDADRRQLGPDAVLDVRSLVTHPRAPERSQESEEAANHMPCRRERPGVDQL
jgi:hypothetical protein